MLRCRDHGKTCRCREIIGPPGPPGPPGPRNPLVTGHFYTTFVSSALTPFVPCQFMPIDTIQFQTPIGAFVINTISGNTCVRPIIPGTYLIEWSASVSGVKPFPVCMGISNLGISTTPDCSSLIPNSSVCIDNPDSNTSAIGIISGTFIVMANGITDCFTLVNSGNNDFKLVGNNGSETESMTFTKVA